MRLSPCHGLRRPWRRAVSPLRIALHQAKEARTLILTGHTKRARRKIRSARRHLSGYRTDLLRSARRLLHEALDHLIELDNGAAVSKISGAVDCLLGVRS